MPNEFIRHTNKVRDAMDTPYNLRTEEQKEIIKELNNNPSYAGIKNYKQSKPMNEIKYPVRVEDRKNTIFDSSDFWSFGLLWTIMTTKFVVQVTRFQPTASLILSTTSRRWWRC